VRFVRQSDLGQVTSACACASASDHAPVNLAINTGRIQRRQRVVTRPASISELRDPDTRLEFARKFGADIWRRAELLGSLEDRGAAVR
jgi:hypothetical protein